MSIESQTNKGQQVWNTPALSALGMPISQNQKCYQCRKKLGFDSVEARAEEGLNLEVSLDELNLTALAFTVLLLLDPVRD
jgi:hypothetical protein